MSSLVVLVPQLGITITALAVGIMETLNAVKEEATVKLFGEMPKETKTEEVKKAEEGFIAKHMQHAFMAAFFILVGAIFFYFFFYGAVSKTISTVPVVGEVFGAAENIVGAATGLKKRNVKRTVGKRSKKH